MRSAFAFLVGACQSEDCESNLQQMEHAQSNKYRVVERDGRLVVELREKPQIARVRRWHIKLPAISLKDIGIRLFRHRHYCELTDDGFAIVSAGELEGYIKLDARSYDLYYLNDTQQSLLGWYRILGFVIAPLLLILAFVGFTEGVAAVFLFVCAIGSSVLGIKFYTDHIESIHGQRFEAEV